LRIVSEVPLFEIKALPADRLHGFNFFTMSIKREYLNLDIEAFPAYSNITRLTNLTSG